MPARVTARWPAGSRGRNGTVSVGVVDCLRSRELRDPSAEAREEDRGAGEEVGVYDGNP